MARDKSGYYYPNKFAKIILESMEDVMGTNGLNTVLNRAGLQNYVGNYPPDNLEKGFDFADFSSLTEALEDMYGARGGR
ncbi:MAG: 4-vinyl reductase, partial [Anaerolineae bacterium]|nr:4-vinyl reductase [Anaerolineae bacterium]